MGPPPMRIGRLLAVLALAGAGLAACAPKPAIHDKAWYAANANERQVELIACEQDPGRLGASPDCVNARSADADAHAAHFYDVPKPAPRVQTPGQL